MIICNDFKIEIQNIEVKDEITKLEVYPELVRIFTKNDKPVKFYKNARVSIFNHTNDTKILFTGVPTPQSYLSINRTYFPFEVIVVNLMKQYINIQFNARIIHE